MGGKGHFLPEYSLGPQKLKFWRDRGYSTIKGGFLNTANVSKLSERHCCVKFEENLSIIVPTTRSRNNHSSRVLGIRIGLIASHRAGYLNSLLFVWKFARREHECS